MLRDTLVAIMNKVKQNSASHPKYITRCMDLYKKKGFDEFSSSFMFILIQIFKVENEQDTCLNKSLAFCSKFCAEVAKKEDAESETHPFLTKILEDALHFSRSVLVQVRNNSSLFVKLVLQHLGDDMHLDHDLCDIIQEAMLERMQDPKVSIRLMAISALVRLQDPYDIDCPVIKAFLVAIHDNNGSVRREVTKAIAPNVLSLGKIRDRVRDVDHGVRMAAFSKCADIGPMSFKIIDRLAILTCGFCETHEATRNAFLNGFLSKWVLAYKGDFLALIRGLKLSSSDDDMAQMVWLSRRFIEVCYKKYPIDDLVAALPVSKSDKLVPISALTNDVVLYWCILVDILRDSGDMDDFLDSILPDMTPFCKYIENYVETKSAEKMDEEWMMIDYQFNVYNLFEMVNKYDFSDEVGRRTLYKLVRSMLQKYVYENKLLKILMEVMVKCSTNVESFTNDVCEIISEIREPIVEVQAPLSEDAQHKRKFQRAQINVKKIRLNIELETAVANQDFQKAHAINEEINECSRLMEDLEIPEQPAEKVRTVKSDDKTICRCLDLVIAMLQVKSVLKLTPSLTYCKDEFVTPLIVNISNETHWRILKCLGLFSIIDRPTAHKYTRVISIPMATYRSLQNYDVLGMVQSIICVSDLIRVHGIDILMPYDGEKTTESNSVSTATANKRKLYNNDSGDAISATQVQDNMSLAYIYEVYLDMLDDEIEDIRHAAIEALTKLIMNNYTVTSAVISRIILKWYNPVTAEDGKLLGELGNLINNHCSLKNSGEILVGAVVPTMTSIANAPRASPLSDVDLNNVIHLFSTLIGADDTRILALDVCMKISENVNDKVVPSLIKLLNQLRLPTSSAELTAELLQRAEQLLEKVKDKNNMPNKQVHKFVITLREKLAREQALSAENTMEQTAEQKEATVEPTETNNDQPVELPPPPQPPPLSQSDRNSSARFSSLPAAESTRVRMTNSLGKSQESHKRVSKINLPCTINLKRLRANESGENGVIKGTLEEIKENKADNNNVMAKRIRDKRISKIDLPCKVHLKRFGSETASESSKSLEDIVENSLEGSSPDISSASTQNEAVESPVLNARPRRSLRRQEQVKRKKSSCNGLNSSDSDIVIAETSLESMSLTNESVNSSVETIKLRVSSRLSQMSIKSNSTPSSKSSTSSRKDRPVIATVSDTDSEESLKRQKKKKKRKY